MAVLCSPFGPKPQFELSDGTPAVGNQLFFYVAGSVGTKQNTYTDSTGGSANTNPLILNALGMPTTQIWFTAGQTYKVVYAPSTDTDPPTSPIWTIDNLSGINDVSASFDQWVTGPAPTFVSATSFTLVGDQTSTFTKSRRIKTTNTAGTAYSTITNSTFGALTTITVANDVGGNTLDSGLSAVSYSLISATNTSIDADMVDRKGASVTSAATTDIWSIAGNYAHVTGTTAITSFGTAPYAGARREIVFDGIVQITHNATTLQCPGGFDIWTAAGDRAIVRADTTANMIVVDFQRADGQSPTPLPKSFAPNPFFQIDQRAGGSIADDTYGPDRWYSLTQTAAVTYSMQTLQENGQASNVRVTQSNAAAQRYGFATILEAKDSTPWRGRVMTFRPRVRISNSQALRMAVLEWTGTADAVTSDVVNDWTSSTYTAGNFFLAANLTVTGVTSKTPGAATWTDMDPLTVTIGNSCNNLILFLWTEATAAQNVTLDIGKVRFVPGSQATDIYIPTFIETLRESQRYFWKSFIYTTAPAQNAGTATGEMRWTSTVAGAGSTQSPRVFYPVSMRVSPTITLFNPAAANAQARDVSTGSDCSATSAVNPTADGTGVTTTGNGVTVVNSTLAVHISATADL